MKNLNEFKALIEKYESITAADINTILNKTALNAGHHVMFKLTGFGSLYHCSLCTAIAIDCKECVWQSKSPYGVHCNWDEQHETYKNICKACGVDEILKAIKARTSYMREYLKQKSIDIS